MNFAELVLLAKTDSLRRGKADLKDLRDEGERTERGLTGSMGKVSSGFSNAAKAAGALAAAVGVGSALNKAINDARGFSRGLAEVSTLIEGTPAQMDALAKSSKALAASFGTTSQAQVEAYYQAISAGAASVEEAAQVLDAANRFAVGGVTDVTTGVDVLTTAMNAYAASNLTAADASDALFVGIKGGKTTANELAAALGNIVPIASAAGISFDEVVAATAALTTQGLGTSEAVTGLRQTISGIIKPTSEAAKEAERLGIAFSADALADQGLAAFLEDVIDKTGGSQESLAQLFGSVEALNTVLSMAGGGGEAFNDILADMEAKAGATAAAYDKMAESADNRLSVATSQMSVALLEIGEAVLPMLVPAVQAVAQAVVTLSGNMDEIGPVLAAAGIAFAALAAPITAIGVAMGTAAILIVNNWDDIKKAFSSAEEFRAALDKIVEYVAELGGRLVGALKEAGKVALQAALQIGADIVAGIRQGIEQKWDDLKGYVAGLGTGMLGGIKDALGIRSPSREFMEVGRYSVEGLEIGWRDNDYLITDAIGSTVDWMIDGFKGGFDALKGILLNSLKEMARIAIGNPIKVALTAALTGGAGAAAAAGQGGVGSIASAAGGISNLFGGSGFLGMGGGTGFLGLGAESGLATALGGGALGTIGSYAIPILGVGLALGALFKKTEVLVAEGVRARIDGAMLELDSYEKTKTDNGFGFSSGFSRDFDRLDDAVQATVQAQLDATINALGAFGFGTDLTGFSFSKRTEIKDGETFEGESEEVIREALDAAIGYLAGGALELYQRAGEGLSDTLNRLATSVGVVNETFELLGFSLMPITLAGADAADALASLFGGVEGFAQGVGAYVDAFYDDASKLDLITKQVTDMLSGLNVNNFNTAMNSREDFRALTDWLGNGAATMPDHAQWFADLINAAPLVDQMFDLREALAQTDDAVGDVTTGLDSLNQVAREQESLLLREARLKGDTAYIRAQELASVDASNVHILERIFALEDEQAAAESAARAAEEAAQAVAELARQQEAIAREADGLMSQYERLIGDQEAIRARELAGVDEANRWILEMIHAREDEVAAMEAAEQAAAELEAALEAEAAKAREIADERAGLEKRILELLGDTAALRQLEIDAVDAANRHLVIRIHNILDEQAAAEQAAQAAEEAAQALEAERQAQEDLAAAAAAAAQAIADEAYALETQWLQATGDVVALRARELELLDPSNRAMQQRIWAYLDEQEALEAAAQAAREAEQALLDAAEAERQRAEAIAGERYRLETQLLELAGDTAALRARELALLDVSNQAMQERIWAIQDENAATEAANRLAADQAQERLGLEGELLRLQGNTAELRRRELEALFPANWALQEQIWALLDAEEAQSAYNDALSQARADMRDALSLVESLIGTEIDAIQSAAQARIDALQSEIDMARDMAGTARDTLQGAFDVVRASIDADRTMLVAGYTAAIEALDNRMEAATANVDRLRGVFDLLDGALSSRLLGGAVREGARYMQAQSYIRGLTGLPANTEALEAALQALSGDGSRFYGNATDFEFDFLRTNAALSGLRDQAGGQLSDAERQVAAIEGARAAREAQHERELTRLDDQLAVAQGIYDEALGQTINLMDVGDGIDGLRNAADQYTSLADQLLAIEATAGMEIEAISAAAEAQVGLLEDQLAEARKSVEIAEGTYQSIETIQAAIDYLNQTIAAFSEANAAVNQQFAADTTQPIIDIPAEVTDLRSESSEENARIMEQNRQLTEEVRQLRDDVNQLLKALVKNTGETRTNIQKWETIGLPPERTS